MKEVTVFVSMTFLIVVYPRVLQSLWELLLRMILDTVGENRGVQVEFYTRFQYTVEVSAMRIIKVLFKKCQLCPWLYLQRLRVAVLLMQIQLRNTWITKSQTPLANSHLNKVFQMSNDICFYGNWSFSWQWHCDFTNWWLGLLWGRAYCALTSFALSSILSNTSEPSL